jgi:hypothetical protein
MVKDVKMCKSAGKTALTYHWKKQKEFKKPASETPKKMFPA